MSTGIEKRKCYPKKKRMEKCYRKKNGKGEENLGEKNKIYIN